MTAPATMYQQLQAFVQRELTIDRDELPFREVAYQAIKEAILRGVLHHKEPLIEERLAHALQISRTPVREALGCLEHEGLVRVRAKGLYVNTITQAEFASMCLAIEVLEAAIATEAARHGADTDIRAMEEALHDVDRHVFNLPLHLAACRRFARLMGQSAGEEYARLTLYLVQTFERSDLYLIASGTDVPVAKLRESVADRRAFLEAIRAHDVDAASAAAHTHGAAIRTRWQDLLVKS